ncbi:hypothetical protein [Aquimarina sp. RZ0]|uniref:hypothetical protein n=1 Tax=Aquimarina sp. RZ0 TaxID=2607730 RepID=UPI0011F1EE6C|nr:hypothetical protein [Aquimarina sp. RZ0]KAA1243125.1 hypothetical protein F0000_22460 [Aquimarina sp. RZ0]
MIKGEREGNAGLGSYHFKTDENDEFDQNTLGVPMNAKLMFYPARRFALGLGSGVNFNSINTTYSLNTVFQFN